MKSLVERIEEARLKRDSLLGKNITPITPYPAIQAKGSTIQSQRKMEAVGKPFEKPAEPKNLFWSLLEFMDKGRNVSATLLTEYGIKNNRKENFWEIAKRGWDYDEPIYGQNILDIALESMGLPESKPQDFVGKASKFLVGLAIDALLDPFTYLSFGIKPLAKSALTKLSPILKTKWMDNVYSTITKSAIAEQTTDVVKNITATKQVKKTMINNIVGEFQKVLLDTGLMDKKDFKVIAGMLKKLPTQPLTIERISKDIANFSSTEFVQVFEIISKHSGIKGIDWMKAFEKVSKLPSQREHLTKILINNFEALRPKNEIAKNIIDKLIELGAPPIAANIISKHLKKGKPLADDVFNKIVGKKSDEGKAVMQKIIAFANEQSEVIRKSIDYDRITKEITEKSAGFTDDLNKKLIDAAHRRKIAPQFHGLPKSYGGLASLDDVGMSALGEVLDEIVPIASRYKTHLKIAGTPVFDLSPVSTYLGGKMQRLPFVTNIWNRIGDGFSSWHIPLETDVVTRRNIQEVRKLLGNRLFKTVYERDLEAKNILKDVLGQISDKNISPEIRKIAGLFYDNPSEAANYIRAAKESKDEIWKYMEKAVGAKRLDDLLLKEDELIKSATYLKTIGEKYFADKKMALQMAEIPMEFLENYFPIFFTDDKDVVMKVFGTKIKERIAGAKAGFMNHRAIFDSIEKGIKAGLHPITDMAKVIGVYEQMYQQAIGVRAMEKILHSLPENIRGSVFSAKAMDKWVRIDSLFPGLKGGYVNPQVAHQLTNLMPIVMQQPEAINMVMKGMRQITNQWKATVLSTPGFLMRNAAGIIFLNIADGNYNVVRSFGRAMALYYGIIDNIMIDGVKYTRDDLINNFNRLALRGAGEPADVLVRVRPLGQKAQQIIDTIEGGTAYKIKRYAQDPRRIALTAAEEMDTIGKFSNWLYHLGLGEDFATAAHNTRTAMFDYKYLTKSEKVIRDIGVPFYAWTRFVMPRIMEKVMGQPGLFTGTAHVYRNFFNINEVGLDEVNDWMRDTMAIPLKVDDDGNVFYLNWSLPLTELSRIHSPLDIKDGVREALMMANPVISTLYQIGTNKHLLTGAEIKENPYESDLIAYGRMLVRQLGLPRQVLDYMRYAEEKAEYAKMLSEGEQPEMTPRKMDLLTGTIGAWYNPASFGRSKIYEERRLALHYGDWLEQDGVKLPESDELEELPGDNLSKIKDQVMFRSDDQQIRKPPIVIKQAIKISGVGIAMLPKLDNDMIKLSGGNPMAQSKLWYNNEGKTSTSRLGVGWYKKQGLYQLTKKEFEKHRVKGHNNIFDPLDNTLAYINKLKEEGKIIKTRRFWYDALGD